MVDHFFEVKGIGNTVSVFGELSLRSFPLVCSRIFQMTRQAGYRDVTLDFENVTNLYPSVCPPFASYCQYLRQEYKVDFDVKEPNSQYVRQKLRNFGIYHFVGVERGVRPNKNSADPQVLAFRSADQQHIVVDSILNAMLRKVKLERPQLKAVEWAISEITDNVINHSGSKVGGYIIASRIPGTDIIEFCVADSGIGIASSLGLADEELALERAIQEGVTRNKQTNQGNGLYGTFRLAQVSEGTFSLKSGAATLYVDKRSTVKVKIDRLPFRGTIVLCQIDCGRDDLIKRALVFDGRAHDPAFDYLEKMHETDDSENILVKASDICKTFGSRQSGIEARNYITNLIKSYPSNKIVIDLTGVNIVSSSFADEVFGKLFVQLGPMRYMRQLIIHNTCSEVETVVDRAITFRSRSGLDQQGPN